VKTEWWIPLTTEQKKQALKRRKKSKKKDFKPDSKYIEDALNDYLEHGGTITKVYIEDDQFEFGKTDSALPKDFDEQQIMAGHKSPYRILVKQTFNRFYSCI
jgi:hypothetical protein